MTLTQWFSPKTKPVRKGIYQRKTFLGDSVYAYWNKKWYCYSSSIDIAFDHYVRELESNCKYMEWRGIAE
jgi:hypothetical protein